jgi:hypothetical protein
MNGMSGTENSSETTPKLFEHCVRLYDLMNEQATDASDGRFFIGHMISLIKEIGLSQSYQAKIANRMKAMGCILLVKRGAGPTYSVYKLLQQPTLELFQSTDETGERLLIRNQERENALEQRVSDLHRRIQAVEDYLRMQGGPF